MSICIGTEKHSLSPFFSEKIKINYHKNILILGNIGSGIEESIFPFIDNALDNKKGFILILETGNLPYILDKINKMIKLKNCSQKINYLSENKDTVIDKLETEIDNSINDNNILIIDLIDKLREGYDIKSLYEIVNKKLLSSYSRDKRTPVIVLRDYDYDFEDINSLFLKDSKLILEKSFYQVVLARPINDKPDLFKESLPNHISHLMIMRLEFNLFENNQYNDIFNQLKIGELIILKQDYSFYNKHTVQLKYFNI